MTTQRPSAKKVLKNIDFSDPSSHIALVGPAIGGPANGADYALVMKAVESFSPQTIEKMQKIKVTLSVPEFLERFFHLYGSDAQVLARMMGYVPEEPEEIDYDEDWYENMIQDRLASFEVMKSMKDGNVAETLSKLDEKQYLKLLRDQSKLEKAFRQLDRIAKKSTEATASVGDTSTQLVENTDVEAIASETELEKSMSTNNDSQNVEMVEKSALVQAETKVSELLEQITKANERIAAFEAQAAESIRKARFEKVKAVVKDEAKAEVLFKALNLVEKEEDFEAALKPLADMQSAIEKSAMFEEQGAAVETNEPVKESGVAKALKAQLNLK